jgi:hypothetical protein
MPRACIMAVDPGLKGAVAYFWPQTGRVEAYDMPVADGHVDVANLADLVKMMTPDLALVEQVGAMPGQGVSSMFKFGCGYGMVRGVIAALGVPLHLVTPAKWKKHFGLSSNKEASRALALRLWPTHADLFKLKKHEARAEAALLALYAQKMGL